MREALVCTLDVRYGAGPNMTADLFPAPAAGAPIQVFIHGGYWRAMDKDVHSFPAEGFVAAGGAAVSLNYALAPAVTLDTIVEQCRTAIEWLADNAGRLNGDPDRIFVSGHSAGGHLTAMMLCTDWAARGRPAGLVKGGTAISGIFDLAPLRETSINDDVRLDAESAARNSPIHHLPQTRRTADCGGRRGGNRPRSSPRTGPSPMPGRRAGSRPRSWRSKASTTTTWSARWVAPAAPSRRQRSPRWGCEQEGFSPSPLRTVWHSNGGLAEPEREE